MRTAENESHCQVYFNSGRRVVKIDVTYKSHNGHVVIPPQALPLEAPAVEAEAHTYINKQQGDSGSSVNIRPHCLFIVRELLLQVQWQLRNHRRYVCGHDVEVMCSGFRETVASVLKSRSFQRLVSETVKLTLSLCLAGGTHDEFLRACDASMEGVEVSLRTASVFRS